MLSRKSRGIMALVVLTGLFLGAVLLLVRLQVNNAPEAYFPADAPAVVFDRALREHFPEDEVLALVFKGEGLLDDETLSSLDRVVEVLQQRSDVDRVLGLTTVDHILASEEGFAVEPLIDPGQLETTTQSERRQRVLSNRFAPGLLASHDLDTVALMVRPVDLQGSLERLELFEAAHRAVHAAGLDDRLVASAGQVALAVAELRSMVRDSLIFVPATVGMGLLLIWWLFRRPLAVAMAFLAIATAAALAVAVIAVSGRPYTLVAATVPPLMAALTIALLIHFYNALRNASLRGVAGEARVQQALQEVRRPALFTALTTAAGLSSMALSPVQPVQTFGIAAGIGALLIFPLVIGGVAQVFAAWDRAPWPGPRGLGRGLDRMVDRMARLAIRRAGWVVGISALVIAVATPFVFHVRAETDLYQFFGPDHWLTQSTRLMEEELSGVSRLEVVFDAEQRDALKDPERLRELQEFARWLENLPQVDRTFGMQEIVEDMHWAFHGEDPAYRAIPESRDLISQYLFIYDGRDLYELVNRDFTRTRLTMHLNVHGANEIQQVIDRIADHLRADPVADLEWRFAGISHLFAEQEDLLVQGQVRSLWGALILIFVLMALMWRSPSAAALGMIPNVAPVLIIFAIMGATGIPLDVATAMIASIAVGVAVDDTIHIYEGFRRRRQAGRSLTLALLRTYRQAGRAVAATTLILAAQFLLLTASAFVPTAQFGLLTAIGLVAALAFDLLLLPAILVLVSARPRGAPALAAR